jgi:hypothetical protein
MSNEHDVHDEHEDAEPPNALRILPILVIVLAVSWVSRALGGAIRVDWTTWTMFVLAGAGLLGMPALFWALDHRKTKVWQLALLGAVIGIVPMIAVLASGVLGRFARGGWPYTRMMLERGATIPTYGFLSWPMFVRIEIFAALVGAASAAIYWVVFVAPWRQRRLH